MFKTCLHGFSFSFKILNPYNRWDQADTTSLFQNFSELLKSHPPKKTIKQSNIPIEFDFIISSDKKPEIKISISKLKKDLSILKNSNYRINVTVSKSLGIHAFPTKPRIKQIALSKDIKTLQNQQLRYNGFVPNHLNFNPIPKQLPKELEAKPRTHIPIDFRKDIHAPTTIFPPDDRYTFNDTDYPWSTIGRVDTAGGYASGVMIRPRHLLTCSHAIDWRSDGTVRWIKFTPSYFDGSGPFGTAYGEWIYFERKVDGSDGINRDEGQHDYVAVVLDRRIGELTGWMGGRSWSDSWDGNPYWRHIGYPGDLAAGQRPSYQRDISLDGSFWDREVHTRIWHKGDVWPGQSGGPYFAWWEGESWPSVVAVQSGQTTDENSASGGAHMIELIIDARNDFP